MVDGFTNVWVERCRFDEHPVEPDQDAENGPAGVFFTLTGHYSIREFPHAGLWRVDVLREHGPPVDTWLTIQPEPQP